MKDPITFQMLVDFFTTDLRLYIYLGATLLGIVVNFLKVTKIDPATTNSVKKYWATNARSSALSIIGAIIGFAYLYEQGTDTLLAYFGIGYMSDSVLNKAAQIASTITSSKTPDDPTAEYQFDYASTKAQVETTGSDAPKKVWYKQWGDNSIAFVKTHYFKIALAFVILLGILFLIEYFRSPAPIEVDSKLPDKAVVDEAYVEQGDAANDVAIGTGTVKGTAAKGREIKKGNDNLNDAIDKWNAEADK